MNESHLQFYQRWQTLADLGCGLGNFVELLNNREFYIGLDSDQEMITAISEKYKQRKNMVFLKEDISRKEVYDYLRSQAVDTIFCVNVLEHLADDRLALNHMVEALPAGGKICLLVPAHRSLFGSLDKLDGHYRRYAKRGFREILSTLPVEVEKLYYFNLAGALGWFFKSRVMRQYFQADENFTLMNKLVPLLRILEGWIHPPLGLSLVAVLRKR